MPGYAAPFRIEPGASKIGLACLGLLHALALLASWFNGFPVWIRVFLMLLVAVSAALKIKAAPAPSAIRELEWQKGKGWTLTDFAGRRLAARLLGGSRVSVHCALLQFSVEGRRRDLLIWPDTLSPEDFRQLRVLLTVEGAV